VETPVFILAGGRAERLAGVADGPKPLLEVAGRPFLSYLLEALARDRLRRVFLLTGVGADAFDAYLDTLRRDPPAWAAGLELACIREETPLGTGGALRGALAHASEGALLLNGDTYCSLDHRALLALHAATGDALCLAAARVADATDYGTLALAGNGMLEAFREKGAGGPGWVNAGVYVLPRGFLEAIPPGPSSLEHDLLPAWLAREPVWGYRARGFTDIGTPERLARARREFPPADLARS
jgi:D-glycero-alpha-D-manno-heptose 1-phosphate guanylyltransferase